ncbi:MAG: site-specific integrase [Clostridia bacterium]|nr:site-specific integrase [Clostridia bacterium]
MKICYVFDEFIENKRLIAKESTIANYHTMFINHFPFWNEDITEATEEEVRKHLLSLKDRLADKTRYDIITLINGFFAFAFSKGYINQKVNFPTPKLCKKKVIIFNESEAKRVAHYILDNFSCINLSAILALFLGVRIGEICALQWRDFNFKNGTINIENTLQRIKDLDNSNSKTKKTKIVITSPKTPSSLREIPLPDFLLAYFKKYAGKPEWYILTANTKYMEPRTLQKHYRDLLNIVDVDYRKFHALRHTFATQSNHKGMDVKTLQEILGHENISFTLAQYVHPDLTLKREQINNIYTDIKAV